MEKTFTPQLNPLFTEFSQAIDDFKQNEGAHVDFDLYLQESTPLQYCTDNENAFYKSAHVSFPEEMARQIEQPHSDYKLGFLKAINHVWLARGSSLFLWDFSKKDSKVFRYNTLQAIEHVDIATFTTHHELVVTTRNYIYLHTISPGQDKIQISKGIEVDSEGVVMSDFVTAKELRRIFMKGDDGHLYELHLVWINNTPKDGSLTCLTMNPILRYLTMFFKSPPVASVKSLVLDEAEELLYMLLSDSSIHVAQIRGTTYSLLKRYESQHLESILLVQDAKKPCLMAVAGNGDRLFLQNENLDIQLIFTRPAPPLPGSILFNNLTDQHADLCYYQQGLFAAVLAKSEKKYFVLTSTSVASVKESKPVLVEDFYYEKLDDKVWSIMEEGGKAKHTKFTMKSTLESMDTPDRQISALTKRGITHYNKQHITDHLQSALQSISPEHLHKFEERYGAIEACCIAHALSCSPKQTPHAIEYIRQTPVRQEGLLRYFARIVQDIWTVDIKHEKASKEKFMAVQERLRVLANVYQQHEIPAIDDMDLVLKTMEFISLICFVNDVEWEQILSRLGENWLVSKFSDVLTTCEGGNLIQHIVYKAIETSKLANASNNYNFIGNFLNSNCSNLLGTEQVIYFKGVENLYAAQNNTDASDKKQALSLALRHFQSVVGICDAPRIKALAQQFCNLGDHRSAVDLAFTSYSQASLTFDQVQTFVLHVIKEAIDTQTQQHAIDVITSALEMTSDQNYHYHIYEWLANKEHNHILTRLQVSTLFDFINTHTLDPRQRLILLELYYAHRNEIAKSADTVYQLATEADQVGLLQRVQALKKACEYLPQADGFSKEKCQAVQRKYKVAQVQYEIFELLHVQKHPDKKVLDNLGARLVPEYDLLQCAYTQSLYEQGLTLLDILQEYNWDFARLAWENIIQSSSAAQEQLQHKLNTLAKKLFPSITSFPVYIVYEILQAQCTKFGDNFAETALIKAGIPAEVVSDAKAEFK
ncbi:hypothetical protein MAM1_0131c06141 [Mucor ambiguus]|uniref:Uncharacterized protein n=1 Tax=Mucor ambiguus TaxID=91626 RepID=A0A0C9MH58_9FUNG|nr:hypothetical protein MAM1_0131c06141 [Mucor ambiguus]